MSVLSRPYFHEEAAAFEHVEGVLWPQGPVCHHCGSMEKHYALKGGRTKPSKKNPHGLEIHGLYKCSDCRKKFTVRMGTIFEESKLPLHIWLQALHAMCASKKGVSAHQLHRALEITYKTAWFLCHRINSHGMRAAIVGGLLVCVGTAHAGELDYLSEKIGGCLVIPVSIGDAPFKVTFEVKSGPADKAKAVTVVAYEPHSEAMAEATPLLAKGVKRCWPPGIKTNPFRFTFSWGD